MRRVVLGALAVMAAYGGAVRAECRVDRIAELPITMDGLRPLTKAQINGQDVTFIVATGLFYSSVSPAKAAELGLKVEPLPPLSPTILVGGKDGRVGLTTVDTFAIAGTRTPRVEFLVLAHSGQETAGLLGQNILHLGDTEYDLAHGAVRLFQPHNCERRILAYWARDIPINSVELIGAGNINTQTATSVMVNGVRLKAKFDTAAGASLITTQAAARAGLTSDMQGARFIGSSDGVGAKTHRTWVVPVASFKIGDEEIKTTYIKIGDYDLGEVDMLLGTDFFLSHRIYVANSQQRIYFSYNGGGVFNLTAPAVNLQRPDDAAAASHDEPTDAEGFSRRGSALAARQDYQGAIKDYTRAIELTPTEGRYFYQRAMANLGLKQANVAMNDLNAAIERRPKDADALVARGELKRAGHDRAGALRDFDAASLTLPIQADMRLRLAQNYELLERFDMAVNELDQWIPAHPDEAQSTFAYNARCWSRASLGRDLDKALDDCNRSIRAARNGNNLDSRGLVRLRRGEYDRAIEDYTAAIALNPKSAWSLYGRGLAKLYKGDKSGGEADIAAAKAVTPTIADTARARGITPPGEIIPAPPRP